MVDPPGGKTAPHSIKAPRFEPLGQIVSPSCCNSFLSLLRVYALQACPSVGGGTAGRPCAGQKFSAQELLSIPSCARLHDSARLTVVDYFQYYRIWRRFNCQN